MLSARWSSKLQKWEVKVKNLSTGEVFTDTANFFISAAGRLNVPKFPDIPGLETVFKGTVFHTSQWTEEVSDKIEGKRVAIIGNGASGQQILVNLINKVAHIDHYVKSRQWVVRSFNPKLISATVDTPGAYIFTEQEKETFEKDPKAYLEYRRALEKNFHGGHAASFLGSPEAEKVWNDYREALRTQVNGDQAWFDRLVPHFSPGCKRPTPTAGYIDAIRSAKVDYVDDAKITHATVDGLVTENGQERKVDFIIVATGFKNGFLPLFPTIGKNELDLSKHWAADGPIGYPETYFGVMAPNMPNYFAPTQVS